MQQNLVYTNSPNITSYSGLGVKLKSYDIKANADCTTLQISSLLFRNKTPSGCSFFRRKLSFLLLLPLAWKKMIFFFLRKWKENPLSEGQWKVTKKLERGEQIIKLVEKIH